MGESWYGGAESLFAALVYTPKSPATVAELPARELDRELPGRPVHPVVHNSHNLYRVFRNSRTSEAVSTTWSSPLTIIYSAYCSIP